MYYTDRVPDTHVSSFPGFFEAAHYMIVSIIHHFLSVIYFMFMSLFMYYRDSSLDNMISVTDMYPSCILSDSAFTPFLSKYFMT